MSNRRRPTNPGLAQTFAAMDGARIPGGCDHCNAVQVPSIVEAGVFRIEVQHDDWCPFLAAYEGRA